jgi:hypothetical protein
VIFLTVRASKAALPKCSLWLAASSGLAEDKWVCMQVRRLHIIRNIASAVCAACGLIHFIALFSQGMASACGHGVFHSVSSVDPLEQITT